ncbi:MAG: hypothetical protein ABI867_42910 [Kofleriaceae bacterium]
MLKLAVVFLLVWTPSARADSEQALSLNLGYATFSVPGEAMPNMPPPSLSPTFGWTLGGSYERALGTDFALRGEVAGGMFFGGEQKDQSSKSYALLVDAGIAFRFDVFKYVPYAFAGVGGVMAGGGPIDRGTDFVIVVGGGLDKLLSRKRSVGAELRIASFGGDITVFTAGFRGTVRWGFF